MTGADCAAAVSQQRDPFAMPTRGEPAAASRPDDAPPFVLRGLVLGGISAIALVTDVDGRARLVREGERLGPWVIDQVSVDGLRLRHVGEQGGAARVVHLRVRPTASADGGM